MSNRDKQLRAKASQLLSQVFSLLDFLDDDSKADMKTDPRLRIEYSELVQATQTTVEDLRRLLS